MLGYLLFLMREVKSYSKVAVTNIEMIIKKAKSRTISFNKGKSSREFKTEITTAKNLFGITLQKEL